MIGQTFTASIMSRRGKTEIGCVPRKLLSFNSASRKLPRSTSISQTATPQATPKKTDDFLSTNKSFHTAFTNIMGALEGNSASTIAVWGMAGVGKSALVKEVEKRAKEKGLFEEVIKADICKTPNLEKIQDDIACLLEFKINNTGMRRAEELRLRLEEKNILIILEDVWDGLSLKAMGIPYGEDHKRCKILLTTRCKQVCIAMRFQMVIPLYISLNDNEAGDLLKMKPGALSDSAPSTLPNASIELAKRYQGLPLAVVELGRALRSGKALPVDGDCFDVLEHTYHRLRLSYNHLRKSTTKLCFFLCSLFPQDYVIDVEVLTRCAWGLGIYEGIESIQKVRCEVWAAIENLISSCLLLEHRETSVKMHNLVRRCALWIASQEKISFMPEIGLKEWRRIEDLPERHVGEELEILSLDGNGYRAFSIALMEGMKSLKVLTLRDAHLSANGLQNLTNLRTLYLEHCQLDDISLLGKLERLEILTFRGSDISELPDEIGGLIYLRLLDLLYCQKLQEIPLKLIWKFSQLEELYFNCSSFEEYWWFKETSNSRQSVTSEIISSCSWPPNLHTYEVAIKEDRSLNDLQEPTSRVLRVTTFSQDTLKDSFPALDLDNHVTEEEPAAGQSSEELRVEDFDQPQHVFRSDEIRYIIEEDSPMLELSKSTRLELIELPQLTYIWNMLTDHAPSLRSLKVLIIRDCQKLTSLFTLSLAERMVGLETLEIHGCNALMQIISDTSPLCLPRLRTIKIADCESLLYVFRITTASFALQLREININHCGRLDRVIEVSNDKTELSHLQQLTLKSLGNLKTICSGEFSLGVPSLEVLEVEACPLLRNCEIMKNEVKDLRLSKVGNRFCEDIIQLENGYFLSSLEKLTLEEISELHFICKDGIQIVTLQHLTHLKVYNCNNLRNIFSVQFARNLPQLSHLDVNGCKELEQVVAHDQTSSSSMSRHKPACFVNLEEIHIMKCNKLRSLFPVSVSHLPKLKKLVVMDASDLKEIFRQDYEGNLTNDEKPKEVSLPQLEKLILIKLPNLLWFSTVGYRFVFPASISLMVKCPRIFTRFSVHHDMKSSYIHAEIEKSKFPGEGNVHTDITLGRVLGYGDVRWPDQPEKSRSL